MKKLLKLFSILVLVTLMLASCKPQSLATEAPPPAPTEIPPLPTEPTVDTVPVEDYADLILINGTIYMVDAGRSIVQAAAVKNGVFTYVGDNAGAQSLAGPETKVLDLKGKMVLPGLFDAHNHANWAVSEVYEVALWGLTSKEEMVEAIQQFLDEHPDITFLMGSGWVNPVFPPEGPSKEILDEINSEIPIVLASEDYHSVWVNSKALEEAGITKDTPNPDGGIIEKNASGEPNGTLRESAMDLAYAVIPSYSTEQFIEGLTYFQDMAHALGYTGVHIPHIEGEAGDHSASLEPLEIMEKDGLLSMRMRGALGVYPEDDPSILENMIAERDRNKGGLFEVSAIKIFMDGVLEASTAFLEEDYVIKPGYRGELLWDPEKYNELCALFEKEGFQIHVHSIGDAATRITLDGFAYAREKNGIEDPRNMITHLQLVNPEDFDRFAELDVIAVPQPYWAVIDSYYTQAVDYIGQERADTQYPIKSFFDRGVVVASASDYPVTVPFNPFAAMETGVTRAWNEAITAIETDPEKSLNPSEAVTIEDMIASYTINAAYANFMESEIGSIEIGKKADFIVIDQNLLEIPSSEIHNTQVLLTYFNGTEVYRAASYQD